ncbi:hypothetical protein [Streptomyces syringium]|uniref:hypothetical protein n=1 Tax=Streptomyces syringium TaxID=76729 RepID=UPI003452C93A
MGCEDALFRGLRVLRDRGTHLLWRIERRKARRVQNVLPDGSYLARIEVNKHS